VKSQPFPVSLVEPSDPDDLNSASVLRVTPARQGSLRQTRAADAGQNSRPHELGEAVQPAAEAWFDR